MTVLLKKFSVPLSPSSPTFRAIWIIVPLIDTWCGLLGELLFSKKELPVGTKNTQFWY